MKRESAVEKLILGENENCTMVKPTGEYLKLFEKVVKYDKTIRDKLSDYPELLELYDKTNDFIENMHGKALNQYYLEGFKSGFFLGFDLANE